MARTSATDRRLTARLALLPAIPMLATAMSCRVCTVELDRMADTAFPEQEVVRAGQQYRLESIFARVGIPLVVEHDEIDIPSLNLAPESLGEDRFYFQSELDTLQKQHRRVPVDPIPTQCVLTVANGWRPICTRHFVHGMTVNGWWEDAANGEVYRSVAGGVFNAVRTTFFIFYLNDSISSDPVKYFRTVAHEIGHTFNLHHEDAVPGITLMEQTKGLDDDHWKLEFSDTSVKHLVTHPAECVWPGPWSNYLIAPDHDPLKLTHTDPGYRRRCSLGAQAPDAAVVPTSLRPALPEAAPQAAGWSPQSSALWSQLALSIETEKSSFALGEPIDARVRLSNLGPAAVEVAASLEHRFGDLSVWITRADGSEIGVVPLEHLESCAPPSSLEAGGALSAMVPVFFGIDGWTISAPGTYRVHAALRDHGSGARIVAPAGAEISVVDDSAGSLLVASGDASRQAGTFLLWQGGDHLTAGIDLLERVIEAAPGSDVANQARLVLGKSLAYRFRNFLTGQVRPPQPDRALALLDAVDEQRIARHQRVQLCVARARAFLWRARDAQLEGALSEVLVNVEMSRGQLDLAARLAREHPELAAFDQLIARTDAAIALLERPRSDVR